MKNCTSFANILSFCHFDNILLSQNSMLLVPTLSSRLGYFVLNLSNFHWNNISLLTDNFHWVSFNHDDNSCFASKTNKIINFVRMLNSLWSMINYKTAKLEIIDQDLELSFWGFWVNESIFIFNACNHAFLSLMFSTNNCHRISNSKELLNILDFNLNVKSNLLVIELESNFIIDDLKYSSSLPLEVATHNFDLVSFWKHLWVHSDFVILSKLSLKVLKLRIIIDVVILLFDGKFLDCFVVRNNVLNF